MRLQKIILRNIGAYYGKDNQFDLSTTPESNVVLIGGKNGAGKTTLLESIRVALFGCLTYGFMTESDAYYSRIGSLFNRKAKEQNESQYQIILKYDSVENFLPSNYELNRYWIFKGTKIKEYFTVHKDGRLLNERETDNFQNRLREEIPPRLFELCLFDGEDISRIISDGRIPEYLNDAAKVLFNLDLFTNLDKDLQTFKNTLNIDESELGEDSNKVNLERTLSSLRLKLNDISEQLIELHQDVQNTKEVLTLKKRDFEMHGGLHKDTRENLVLEISRLESIRKQNIDQIRSFVFDLLPLYLVRNLVSETNIQMNEEQSVETYAHIGSMLEPDTLNRIVDKLSSKFQLNLNKSYTEQLHKEIIDVFKPVNERILHRASFAQKTEVNYLNHSLDKINVNTYSNMYEENTILLERIQQLKQQLDTNDNSSEFKMLLNDIQNLTLLIEQKKQIIEQKQQDELMLTEEIKTTTIALENETAKWLNSRKTITSFTLAEKIHKVSARFQTMQLRKKLDQVQNEAIKMVQRLFRKKDYITRIYISHESFDLNLYHHQELLVNERLSAGEKEMLMLSIIWAMFKCTGWKLPLVFDTLLGRLDQDHKREIINYFIPNCGDQVIILATDSEVTESQFRDLQQHLSHYYTLEFNTASNRIDINKDHYFDKYDLELV